MGKKRNKKVLRLKGKPKSRPAPSAPGEVRNWSELPRDVTVSILSRLKPVDILRSAQKVCMAWRNVCKDPLMWRHIDMRNDGDADLMLFDFDMLCRLAVDRSCGTVADINIEHFGSDNLLNFITNRCVGIRRLRLVSCYNISDEGLSEVASKIPLLEELEISLCNFSCKPLEVIGRSCPRLKSFKFNSYWNRLAEDVVGTFDYYDESDNEYGRNLFDPVKKDEEALAMAGTMPGLHHLQIFGNQLTNDGLREILDRCPHLESLDLRCCFNLDLKGDLGKRCGEQIKKLRLPNDSIIDYEFRASAYAGGDEYGLADDCDGFGYYRCENYGYGDFEYDSDDSDWYDDFTKIRMSDYLF